MALLTRLAQKHQTIDSIVNYDQTELCLGFIKEVVTTEWGVTLKKEYFIGMHDEESAFSTTKHYTSWHASVI